ncbi:hypothetical protein BD311DRAFT_765678 [Dichomitus squalens]|uniref:Uncharacterized protein n=1 Tax=Dichomitus squalens TaxID=114155 RepID=A0A4Q9MFK0_9APHY|nr:hypothetical protein BD311DRAFT_765678 [Dichomitus squalens]
MIRAPGRHTRRGRGRSPHGMHACADKRAAYLHRSGPEELGRAVAGETREDRCAGLRGARTGDRVKWQVSGPHEQVGGSARSRHGKLSDLVTHLMFCGLTWRPAQVTRIFGRLLVEYVQHVELICFAMGLCSKPNRFGANPSHGNARGVCIKVRLDQRVWRMIDH